MEFIIAAVFVIPIAILGVIWRGYVLSVMWMWFVVPAFAAPELNIPTAIGLSGLIGLAVMAKSPEPEGDSAMEKIVAGISMIMLTPLTVLGIGWIVKGFM